MYGFMFNSLDNSGPVVVFCPPSQNITSEKRKISVTWPEPQFKDNSNSPLQITCSRKSGTVFYWGSYTVHCMAYDNNPNNKPGVCKFELTIRRKYQLRSLPVGIQFLYLSYWLLEKCFCFHQKLPQWHQLNN